MSVAALYTEGDGYFEIAKDSTALHVAAWRAWHGTVRFLIERGAPIDARDGKGRTALALAVRACVDSFWTYRRSPESVQALLDAGTSVSDVVSPQATRKLTSCYGGMEREGRGLSESRANIKPCAKAEGSAAARADDHGR